MTTKNATFETVLFQDRFTEHLLESNERAKQFIQAGKAIFTIRNEETMNRFTYKFKKARSSSGVHWVYVLTGSDNEHDYKFIGGWSLTKGFICSPQSQINPTATSVKAIEYYTRRLFDGSLPEKIKTYHMNHCGRCGRLLTVPESIVSGYGPECIHLVSIGA